MDNVVELRKRSPQQALDAIEVLKDGLNFVVNTVNANVENAKELNIPVLTTLAASAEKALNNVIVPATNQVIGSEDDGENSGKATMYTCAAVLERMVKETGVED